ncbi:enoyl-CoA hydratase-related protein [Allobacillus sp. GCM10007491]|uniref:Enoyl-CoA hydratase/isomerase family protein n=1 Tax=Allobacillus saliphilus TaxID=2912308 RepID=A0A941CSL6_9BACI|nr:enoyl-CoA hydratase-related protein [Allobacillus saliphilus]MBR7553172.1 enoyl-CoA hydratase/isomerase family protein [Allobacillus saliphilus]
MDTIDFQIVDETIGILKLNRPNAANAFSLKLMDDFNEQLDEIEHNDQLRVLIITAAGEKVFCAGADLKERASMDEKEVVKTVGKIGDLVSRVEQLEIPTIAAINGAAFGGGLELALACDIRIASSSAKMGLTETSLAIIPGAGGTQRLSRLIGIANAKYYILTAKRFESDEAKQIGLVQEIFEPTELEGQSLLMAKQIAGNGPIGVKMAKKAIDEGYELPKSEGLQVERACYLETIPTEDRLEGLQAFKEKRKPQYEGK